MTSTSLKNALENAGLTTEEFAEILGVDPKTVQRWVAGTTTPYPRHRAAIARALDLSQDHLWPGQTPSVAPPPTPATDTPTVVGDVIGSWGHSNDPDAPDPITFLAQATRLIDMFDSGGTLHQVPDITDTLRGRVFDGCEIRLLTRASADQLDLLDGLAGVAVRSTPSLSMPTLLRADDTMLFFIPLYGTDQPALLHLRPETGDGLFNRLADHFQKMWDAAEVIADPQPPVGQKHDGDATLGTGRDVLPEPQQEPERPASSGDAVPRRWPRRPT